MNKNCITKLIPSFLMYSLFFYFNNAFGDIIHVPEINQQSRLASILRLMVTPYWLETAFTPVEEIRI